MPNEQNPSFCPSRKFVTLLKPSKEEQVDKLEKSLRASISAEDTEDPNQKRSEEELPWNDKPNNQPKGKNKPKAKG